MGGEVQNLFLQKNGQPQAAEFETLEPFLSRRVFDPQPVTRSAQVDRQPSIDLVQRFTLGKFG